MYLSECTYVARNLSIYLYAYLHRLRRRVKKTNSIMKETNKFREMTLEIHTLTNIPIYERKKFSQMRKSPNVFLLLSFQELECLNNEKVQCMVCDLFECDLQLMIDSLKLIFNETFSLRLHVSLFSFPVALHFIMFLNYKHFFFTSHRAHMFHAFTLYYSMMI